MTAFIVILLSTLYTYILVIGRKFIENNVLNTVNIELSKQLRLHLLPHGVTLCFTYTIHNDDPQTGRTYLFEDNTVLHHVEVSLILTAIYVCMHAYIYIYIWMCC